MFSMAQIGKQTAILFVLFIVTNKKIKMKNSESDIRASFVDHYCYLGFVFVMLSCLVIAALWSPAGKGLTFWLSCM